MEPWSTSLIKPFLFTRCGGLLSATVEVWKGEERRGLRRATIDATLASTKARLLRPRRKRTWVAYALLVALVVLVVRLIVAPLTLPFSGPLAARLAERAGAEVSIRALAAQLGLGRVHLVFRDVRTRAGNASLSASAVRVSVGWSERTVTVEQPVVSVDPSAPPGVLPPLPAEALAQVRAVIDAGEAALDEAGLSAVAITGGRLNVVAAGRPVSEARVFRDVDVRLSREPDTLRLEGRLRGHGGPIILTATARPTQDGSVVEFLSEGIVPRDLAPVEPFERGFALTPRFTARYDEDGAPLSAQLALGVGTGVIRFGRDPPRTLDRAALRVSFEADEPGLRLSHITGEAGGSSISADGTLTPSADGPWTFALKTREAVFDAPDTDDPPVAVDSIAMDGRVDFAERLLHIDHLEGRMEAGSLAGTFTFDFGENGPGLTGAMDVGPSSVPALRAVWPPVVAHEPRTAALTVVRSGILEGASFTMALTEEDLDGDPTTHTTMRGGKTLDAAFSGATLAVDELPLAIQNASGRVRLRDNRFVTALRRGFIAVGDEPGEGEGEEAAGRDLIQVVGGEIVIDDLSAQPPRARAQLTVTAPVTAAVRLAKLAGVNDVQGTPIAPDDVDGRFRATLFLRTPLADDVEDHERGWSIEARLMDASSRVPIAGQVFDKANVELAINARRLAARGRAEIDGLSVEVNYSELFAGASTSAARVVLTDRDRREKGFDTGDMVRGPIVLTLQSEGEANAVTVDLTEAAVSVPGYTKATGEALSAEALVTTEDEESRVEDIRVDGDGVEIVGEAVLRDSDLQSANLPVVRLSEGDDAELTVDRRGRVLHVSASARRFDARPLVSGLGDGLAGAGSDADVSAEISADRVRVGADAVITDLAMAFTQRSGAVQRMSASGRLNGQNAGSFAATLTPDGDVRRLRADVTSLGRLLSGFDIYDRLEDGRTRIDATLGADGIVRGRLVAEDFVIANERTLDELVARAQRQEERQSLERNVAPLALQPATLERGIPFDRLTVDFERRGGVILVREAILRGPVMGGTAEGVIDVSGGSIRLNGTFIPAYGVNNLFGRLPLFGGILGGGREGGLIGVTFRLTGDLGSPVVAVNPISAIAPGIFRRIFEFR